MYSDETIKTLFNGHVGSSGRLKPGSYTVFLDGKNDDPAFCYLRHRLTMGHEQALEMARKTHGECPSCLVRRMVEAKEVSIVREDLAEPEKTFYEKTERRSGSSPVVTDFSDESLEHFGL